MSSIQKLKDDLKFYKAENSFIKRRNYYIERKLRIYAQLNLQKKKMMKLKNKKQNINKEQKDEGAAKEQVEDGEFLFRFWVSVFFLILAQTVFFLLPKFDKGLVF